MRQILWFRRDLRINDNAILANAKDEAFPIFIFDKNILELLPNNDKRVTFIYNSVILLKKQLQTIGLDLAIFYGRPIEIFKGLLSKTKFDNVLCSCDFDNYALQRDKEIESLIPIQRFYDSYLLHPSNALKKDGTPYKVFTPFYKSLNILYSSEYIQEYKRNENIKKYKYDYSYVPSLEKLGFEKQKLLNFLEKTPFQLLDEFILKLDNYEEARDFFYIDNTSKLSVYLRFGLISPKQIFNKVKRHKKSDFFIRELFWREFYNSILYHFPTSENENFNGKRIAWENDKTKFKAWCEGNTGIPIIDAAMRHLNQTGSMHNRLRMVVCSFLTKNLLIDWRWGESYFAQKLLDYDASSNIGSWQWGASTGADSVPYFRVFNPYLQSAKFDKEARFIKSVIPQLRNIDAKLIHKENGVQSSLFIDYPKPIVNIKYSKAIAINAFKNAI